ncbi:MAG: DUF2922 domain-containing protein [Desulfitobacterium sp.]
MATTSRKVLRMVFNTSMAGTMTLTLADPKEGILPAEIEAVMDQIISKDIFSTSVGSLVSKKDIKIVETVTDDVFGE